MTFAFVLNSLCHEMIHYYDTLFGDVLYKALMAFKTKTPFNPHSTKIFNKFMNTLNKDCLTIIPDDGNFNFQELNDLSVYRLKKLQEMDSDLMSGKINKPNENTLSRMSVIDGELIGVVM